MITQAKGELRTLQTAVESYYINNISDNKTYPTSLNDLILSTTVPNIVGTTLPTDPFNPGSNYGYTLGGTNNVYYVIYSIGPRGNGSASITGSAPVTISETNEESCIFVSNVERDTRP